MKIKLGQCRCMAIIYLVEEVGLVWTADMEPLDDQTAMGALLAGRELYRVTLVGENLRKLSMARPEALKALRGEPSERPTIVRSHGCPPGAAKALLPASQQGGGTRTPKALRSPSVAPSRPSSGASRSSAAAPAAVRHLSDPTCDRCGQPCAPGTYWGIQLGAEWLNVEHADPCKE